MNISHQLLEKSRVCIDKNSPGTNFHVFYSLVAHAPVCLKEKFHLSECKFAVRPNFKSHLSNISSLSIFHLLNFKILPPSRPSSTNSFNALDSALRSLGISDFQLYTIYSLLASILHLGNIKFENDDLGYARICAESNECVEFVAELVATNSKQLEKVFLARKLIVPNQGGFVS